MDRHVDLLEIAKDTDGFSGSDLKEMCRDAALLCVREYVKSSYDERYCFLINIILSVRRGCNLVVLYNTYSRSMSRVHTTGGSKISFPLTIHFHNEMPEFLM